MLTHVPFKDAVEENGIGAQIINHTAASSVGQVVFEDAIDKGDRILIVDDLIATAGTASAARNLVKKLGGEIVECAFIVELTDLKGRDKLKGENIYSVVEFEG